MHALQLLGQRSIYLYIYFISPSIHLPTCISTINIFHDISFLFITFDSSISLLLWLLIPFSLHSVISTHLFVYIYLHTSLCINLSPHISLHTAISTHFFVTSISIHLFVYIYQLCHRRSHLLVWPFTPIEHKTYLQ